MAVDVADTYKVNIKLFKKSGSESTFAKCLKVNESIPAVGSCVRLWIKPSASPPPKRITTTNSAGPTNKLVAGKPGLSRVRASVSVDKIFE